MEFQISLIKACLFNCILIAACRSATCMVLSTWSTTPLEDVARCSAPGLKWFQIDMFKRLDVVASVVKRAELQGYKAIVVTVDMPYIGIRYNDKHNGFALPSNLSFDNIKSLFEDVEGSPTSEVDPTTADTHHDPSATWDIIGWFRTITELPIVVKGILTAEDAKLAVQHGVDAIVVSSHGGRQLDGVPATVSVNYCIY